MFGNKAMKEQKLRELASSVFNYPESKQEIKYILSSLNLSRDDILQAYVNYDMDIFAYENEIYESLAMRMALYLHYLLKGSWHQNRQNVILKMLKQVNPKTIVDMGFGAPTKYVREYILKKRNKLVLVDFYDSAFRFAEALLDYLDPSWKEIISFKNIDMNTHEYPGDFETYVFQDSIEHVKNSANYLSKVVSQSQKTSRFILSLPIGPKVPAHTIYWNKEKQAIDWLSKCGLKIENSDKVFINPNVDLFTEQLDKEFYNLIVLCKK